MYVPFQKARRAPRTPLSCLDLGVETSSTLPPCSSSSASSSPCRLCGKAAPHEVRFATDRRRFYLRCAECHLVFVPDMFLLNSCDERAEYDQHENKIDDPGYHKFLARAVAPLRRLVGDADGKLGIGPTVRALDFGCGPGPALSMMLREEFGWTVSLYDKFYEPHAEHVAVEHRAGYYDVIVATEVVEHLANAGAELRRLWSLLRPNGGALVIMTKRVIPPVERFIHWHYKNDPTHISFFSVETFEWLAKTNFLSNTTTTDTEDGQSPPSHAEAGGDGCTAASASSCGLQHSATDAELTVECADVVVLRRKKA